MDIANVVNKMWSVDYVSPTPSDGANLNAASVEISVEIEPNIVKEAAQKALFDDSATFTGSFSSTELNGTDGSVQLTYPSTAGTYTSNVYDGGETVDWETMGWSEFIPTDGELEPQTGLVGAWHLNEGSGDVIDSSGYGNDGAAYGNVEYGVNGTFNTAMQFSQSGYVTIPDSNSLDITNNFTMQAWIKISSDARNKGILFKGADNKVGDYGLALIPHRLRLYLKNQTAVTGTATVDNNQWHHVAATFDGISAKLYVDGVLDGTSASTPPSASENAEPLKIGYYDNPNQNYVNGVIDEIGIWNYALNSSEVLRQYNAKLVNLSFEARSCDDALCFGESFSGSYGNAAGDTLNVGNNRYFQYKAIFDTNKANLTAKLYNVTVVGHTIPEYEDVSISSAWIDMNGENVSMSGSGLSWSYVNTSLLVGGYTYRVYAEDSFGNVNVSQTRTFTVPSYEITFNVTSGEDGTALNNVQITCDYSGFNQNGDTSNMYGAYTFPVGTWSCEFAKSMYYSIDSSFIANGNKVVDVKMSLIGDMTNEEHDWLESLYNCIIGKNCDALTLLQTINQTTNKIWQQFLPTDEDVVLQEDTLSNVLTETNDISLNYTIAVPYKEGYDVGASLPIMISYWFTDENGACYNQDKQTSATNRAETPYCIPLIAEYLGPNNGTVSFKVDLHPNLPDGTYNIVRSIDIDPPVNGEPVWINYGREVIGTVDVINQVKAAAQTVDETKEVVQTVEAKAPTLPRLNQITGSAVEKIKETGSVPILIGLGMICLTVLGLGTTYIRRKWR